MKKRKRDQHRNLKTGQRMTERTKRGAKEVRTGNEDEDRVEILMSRRDSRGASLL